MIPREVLKSFIGQNIKLLEGGFHGCKRLADSDQQPAAKAGRALMGSPKPVFVTRFEIPPEAFFFSKART